jgi:tRNA uridine 5-carbamoylmethylation protein Kti12
MVIKLGYENYHRHISAAVGIPVACVLNEIDACIKINFVNGFRRNLVLEVHNETES